LDTFDKKNDISPLSLDLDKPVKKDTISLSEPDASILPADVAWSRAERYHYAAGKESPGLEHLYQLILSGRENQFRDHLAELDTIQKTQLRNDLIAELIKRKNGGPLSKAEVDFFEGLTYQQLSDPNSIIEELQAKRQITDLFTSSPTPGAVPLKTRAELENKAIADILQDGAEEMLAKRAVIARKLEELNARYSGLSPLGKAEEWSTAIIAGAVPFLWSEIQKNVIKPPYETSWWVGQNKEEQFRYLLSRPMPEFNKLLDAGIEDLSRRNIIIANQFLNEILGYTSGWKTLDTVFNVMDLSLAGSVAVRGGQAVRSAAQAAKAAPKPLVKGLTPKDVAKIRGVGTSKETSDVETLVHELYKDRKSPDEIAKELGITPEEVNRILDEMPPHIIGESLLQPSKKIDDILRAQATDLEQGKPAPKTAADVLPENKRFAEALKQTIVATNPVKPDLKEIASAAGKQDLSVAARIYEATKAKYLQANDFEHYRDLFADLPGLADPAGWFRGAFKLDRELAARIQDRLFYNSALLVGRIVANRGVSSLSEPAFVKAVELARKQVFEQFAKANANDMVLEVRTVYPEETVGNVGYIVSYLGRPNATKFKTYEEAEKVLKDLKIPDAQIKSQGDEFVIQHTHAIDESDPLLRDFMIDTGNQTPRSWATTLLDSANLSTIRSPADLLPRDIRGQRKTIGETSARENVIITEASRIYKEMSKSERKSLKRFLDAMNRYEEVQPDGELVRGLEFRNQFEFEQAWQTMFGRLPTEKEAIGYFNTIMLNDYDLFLRRITKYHGLTRQGVREYQLKPDGPFVPGKPVKEIDWSEPEGNILVLETNGTEKLYTKALIYKNPKMKAVRAQLDSRLKDGWSMIQVIDPWAIREGAFVPFVLTKTAQSRLLRPATLVPRKGGGHVRLDYGAFVKQPSIYVSPSGKIFHAGDRTVYPVTSFAEAQELEKAFAGAARLYSAGDRAAFENYVRLNLPAVVDPEVLWNKFLNGTLKADTPFIAVRSGERTTVSPQFRLRYPEFHNWSDSDLNLLKGLDREFTSKRGFDVLSSYRGTDEDNPIFAFAQSRQIDPLAMVTQALGRASRKRMLQPYQIQAAERFVEEFHSVMDPSISLETMRKNPIAVLHNPRWDPNPRDRQLLAAARAYQKTALRLYGTQTDMGKLGSWLQAKLIDSIYKKAGKDVAEKVYENLYLIPDPITFARQFAFHLKLGLFVPTQLLLQYQTFVNTMAIAPAHAVQGFGASTLARAVSVSRDAHLLNQNAPILNHMAKLAKTFGFKEEDFKEAYAAARDLGMWDIGPQHAFRSEANDPHLFRTGFGSFLDKGQWFFNFGERGNRLAGFFTAYHEWRTANPYAKFDRFAQERVLARQADLTANMTHMESSAINRGPGAIIGQFWSYQERLAELFLGKRLTMAEKARALAIYAAFYGIPVVPAVVGIPYSLWYDDIRTAIAKGEIKNDFLAEAGHQGLFEAVILHRLTGSEQAFTSRMGPSGIPLFQEMLEKDTTFQKILMGASGSIIGDTLTSLYPLAKTSMDIARGKAEANLSVLSSDILHVLENVGSIKQGKTAYEALTMQKYFDKKGSVIDNEVTVQEGIIMGILGTKPTRIDDVSIMNRAIADKLHKQTFYRNEAKRYIMLSVRAREDNDDEAADAYYKRAEALLTVGGFNPIEKGQIAAEALTEWQTKRAKTLEKFQREFEPWPEEPESE
jgi:hypothetical protein